MSYLLAGTRMTLLSMSGSLTMARNSSLAAPIRSLSIESTTYICTANGVKNLQHGTAHRVSFRVRKQAALMAGSEFRRYQGVRVAQVLPPERPQLVLPSHVPDREGHVLVLHFLHVETCRDRATNICVNSQRLSNLHARSVAPGI